MLTRDVTIPNIHKALRKKDYAKALSYALALNHFSTLKMVYESIPYSSIPLLVPSIPSPLLPNLLNLIRTLLQPYTPPTQASSSAKVHQLSSPHLQYHLQWLHTTLKAHLIGPQLGGLPLGSAERDRKASGMERVMTGPFSDVRALLLMLLRQLQQHHSFLSRVYASNIHTLRYLTQMPRVRNPHISDDARQPSVAAAPAPAPAPTEGTGVRRRVKSRKAGGRYFDAADDQDEDEGMDEGQRGEGEEEEWPSHWLSDEEHDNNGEDGEQDDEMQDGEGGAEEAPAPAQDGSAEDEMNGEIEQSHLGAARVRREQASAAASSVLQKTRGGKGKKKGRMNGFSAMDLDYLDPDLSPDTASPSVKDAKARLLALAKSAGAARRR